ncbi:unnamed protein product [Pylaiella littoralis]
MPDKPCHYDVLGLDRDASDDEIKRVYRRLALFWHPDKNTPEQRDEATNVFRLVTEAYAVLGDPKRRRAYDRDGHPASAGLSAGATAAASKSASPAASTPSPPPPAPSAPPQHVPEHSRGGWSSGHVGGGWEGVPVGGDYGDYSDYNDYDQGWIPQQQQQQQQQQYQFPFNQAPSPFVQQQHQFQQQDPFPQQQGSAFAYDNQFAHQAYPFQQHQQQVPPPWGTYYDNSGVGGYGAPASASLPPPPLPEPAPASLSTELALPTESPRGGAAAYPGGFPHAAAAAHGIVAHPDGGEFQHRGALSYGTVAHPGVGGSPHHELPCYDLPPVAVAPPSTYPPSSESEESESESEAEDSEQDLAVVARSDSPVPVRTVAKKPSHSLFRKAPKKDPYPTETRYVPPQPERLNANYYPKEMRGQGGQQQERTESNSSGLVLKLHLGTRAPDRAAAPPAPTSVGPSMNRSTQRRSAGTSSRGRSEGSMGGIIQEMDRMFANVMGGGLLGAGVSLDVAGQEGSGRGLNRSFSSGGGSVGGGFARASMMSSRTVVDGRANTLFSRTERTVLNTDGTRETNVQEYRADSSRGSASSVGGSRGARGSEMPSSSGDHVSQRGASTSRRGSLRSIFRK